MRAFLRALLAHALLAHALLALPASAATVAEIVAAHAADIEKPSRTAIGPVIDALAASGEPMAAKLLEAWGNKSLGLRKSDKQFFFLAADPAGYALTDLTGAPAGTADKADITEMKPNAGVRGLIASSLVAFTLSDPDRTKRAALPSTPSPKTPTPPASLRSEPPSTPKPTRNSKPRNTASNAC